MSNGITLGKGASLQQVSDQLKNQSNEDGRLLARTNKHGETVLYARPAAKNVFDKISHFIDRQTGRTERREERAREAVYSLVREVTANRSEFSPGLFKELGKAITQWSNNKQLTGMVLSHISESVRNLPGKPMPSGETLGSLGIARDSDFLKQAANKLAGAGNDKTVFDQVAKDLGDDLVDEILIRTEDDHSLRDAFAMSNGFRLMEEMGSVLQDMLAKKDPPVTLSSDDMASICRTAFLDATSKVRDDGVFEGVLKKVEVEVDDGLDANFKPKTKVVDVEMHHVQVDGKEYEPIKRLGAGGFGEVFEYQSVEGDPKTKIAVKFSLGLGNLPGMVGSQHSEESYSAQLRSAGNEIAMHNKAYGDGSNEIIGLKGHFRMPDGNVAVAMEFAPNGGADRMGKLLADAVPGELTNDEANILRLTMLQDMTEGLHHMHNWTDVSHLDFKPPNCFIGSDGTTKLGDFGMSLALSNLDKSGKFEDIGDIGMPIYRAPELVESKTTVTAADEKRDTDIKSRISGTVKRLKDMFPHGTKDALLVALAANVNEKGVGDIQKRNADLKAGLRFDNKADIWGLGVSGLEFFSGTPPFAGVRFMQDVEKSLVDYMANSNNAPLSDPDTKNGGKPMPGAIGVKTGNAQIDDLLTRMLKPKASDRDGTGQLLNHAAFKIAGVGSKEAKDLIVAMSNGDPAKIAQARQALQALAPQPQPQPTNTTTPTSSTAPQPQTLPDSDDESKV